MSPTLRSAVGSDVGRRRPMNQDSAATTARLLAVADGMGGHAHGEVASAVAIAALLDLDARLRGADLEQVDLLAELGTAIGTRLRPADRPGPAEPGPAGHRHHGGRVPGERAADRCRAHRRLARLPAARRRAAPAHPRPHHGPGDGRRGSAVRGGGGRAPAAVVAGAHAAGGHPAEPDLFQLEGQVGDRYLICSDGVTAVLDDPDIQEVLVAEDEPAAAVDRLIELANEGGGPDNITCVVADLVDGRRRHGRRRRSWSARRPRLTSG